jgi:hypothetical protein
VARPQASELILTMNFMHAHTWRHEQSATGEYLASDAMMQRARAPCWLACTKSFVLSAWLVLNGHGYAGTDDACESVKPMHGSL